MLADIIEKGVLFLLRNQSNDGTWRDFLMEEGESDSWVTAYVGPCLLEICSIGTSPEQKLAMSRASKWLMAAMRNDSSWSYNDRSPLIATPQHMLSCF
jgi:hypothetical protein